MRLTGSRRRPNSALLLTSLSITSRVRPGRGVSEPTSSGTGTVTEFLLKTGSSSSISVTTIVTLVVVSSP